ncbi:hypothetical protein C8Q79DRAFT_927834 [Trametes meyenii]|nr:hypothetical protein C8Q79DRAFT_927834 [Trametes meyenii]
MSTPTTRGERVRSRTHPVPGDTLPGYRNGPTPVRRAGGNVSDVMRGFRLAHAAPGPFGHDGTCLLRYSVVVGVVVAAAAMTEPDADEGTTGVSGFHTVVGHVAVELGASRVYVRSSTVMGRVPGFLGAWVLGYMGTPPWPDSHASRLEAEKAPLCRAQPLPAVYETRGSCHCVGAAYAG